MWVCKSNLNDPLIYSPQGYLFRLYDKLDLNYLILFVEEKLRKLESIILYRFFHHFWPKLINSSDYDVVNLHWVNGEMLSVKDISKNKKTHSLDAS